MAKQKNIKLTDEEIEVFNSVAVTQQQVVTELGKLTLNGKQLEQQFAESKQQLTSQQDQLIEMYNESIKKQQEHTKSLVEKYGEGTLNVDNWEFTPS